MRLSEAKAVQAFEQHRLPMALARELDGLGVLSTAEYGARLACDSFLDVRAALEQQKVAALIPNFLAPAKTSQRLVRVHLSKIESRVFQFYLAWNPRLLRLNPHATRRRDWLAGVLSRRMPGRIPAK